MIQDTITVLTQEPWCYTPEQIGRLTDWQIDFLYARPAVKRAEELRKDLPDHPPPLAPPSHASEPEPEPGSDEHRRMVVSAFVNGPFGMSPEKASAMYESQLAAYRAQNGK